MQSYQQSCFHKRLHPRKEDQTPTAGTILDLALLKNVTLPQTSVFYPQITFKTAKQAYLP